MMLWLVWLVGAAGLVAGAGGAEMLTVHAIAHTHDDVGWIKTPTGYYEDQVLYILSNVVDSLLSHPERRFTYVEMYFFHRWWEAQNATRREQVRSLVQSGRFEFSLGGWCMHDEATTHFEPMIDQMTRGHRFLNATFGVRPTIAWQIDPFGHSATSAYIFAEMGLEAVFFQKINFQEHAQRAARKELELVWKPMASRDDIEIFTHILYSNSDGYTWLPERNLTVTDPIEKQAADFAAQMRGRSTLYTTPHVALLFGHDFAFQDAPVPFEQLEAVMAYINARSDQFGMTVQYSSPSLYYAAVKNHHRNAATATAELPVVRSDFFPCEFRAHYVRSGFYTSRPREKRYDRICEARLAAGRQLLLGNASAEGDTQQKSGSTAGDALLQLWGTMGVHQHHDAMPGTDLQFVSEDYVKLLYDGNRGVTAAMAQRLQALSGLPTLNDCQQLNVSVCANTQGLSAETPFVPVVLYNPTSWPSTEVTAIAVGAPVSVWDGSGRPVTSQVQPVRLPRLPEAAPLEVLFKANVPPMGFAVYWLQRDTRIEILARSPLIGPTRMGNAALFVSFSGDGSLTSMEADGETLDVEPSRGFAFYLPNNGDSVSKDCSSAYAFRPEGNQAHPFTSQPKASATILRGPVAQEVAVSVDDDNAIHHAFRLAANASSLDYLARVGPLQTSAACPHGLELVQRFNTSLDTHNLWFTDSNGLEFQPRFLNYHPTYNVTLYEPIASNFYPTTSTASLVGMASDAAKTPSAFAVVTDRTQGCASLATGSLECMVHRRLHTMCHEDEGYELDDVNPIVVHQKLVFAPALTVMRQVRPAQYTLNRPLQAFFGPPTSRRAVARRAVWTLLKAALPPFARLLTLQPLPGDGRLVVRVQHIFARGEDPGQPSSVVLNMDTYLGSTAAATVSETNMSTNRVINGTVAVGPWRVQLVPMQIRTFLVHGLALP